MNIGGTAPREREPECSGAARAEILVVEDEADLADVLTYSLERRGFAVRTVGSVGDARAALESSPVDLVVLDLMLPDAPGTVLCRWIKGEPEHQSTQVVMATAMDGTVDRIVGFELGADDYVVKPYSVRELVLRVEAILRRTREKPEVESDQLQLGRIRLDRSAYRVWADGQERSLTITEFRLLWVLGRAHGRVVRRRALLQALGEEDDSSESRRVDARVRRLRAKLGTAAEVVETIRGVGHRLVLERPS